MLGWSSRRSFVCANVCVCVILNRTHLFRDRLLATAVQAGVAKQTGAGYDSGRGSSLLFLSVRTLTATIQNVPVSPVSLRQTHY